MIASTCFNHPERLASARCPECSHSYCRECVTEHDGRLVCAACLRKQAAATAVRRNWIRPFLFPAMGVAALFGCWLLFYTTGWWLEQLTAPAAHVVTK